MPGFDGTGPRGMGPMTGGGRGFCASPVYGPRPGYGAGYGLPTWGGRCGRFGRGMGRGMGIGRGMAYPYVTAQVCPMLRIHTLPHRIGHPPMVGKKQDQLDSWAVPRSNQQANPRKLLSLYQISLSEIDRPRLLVRE